MGKIKVGIIGVGNCASAFIQGVYFYGGIEKEEEAVGLKNLYLGGYHPKDIEFVCAFDVEASKVGKDLSEAIFAKPNNTRKVVNVPKLGVKVLKGPVLDGFSESARKLVEISLEKEVDVSQRLKESGTEIVVNLLPSGAVKASEWYAEQSLKAGCAFINATPALIACKFEWIRRFLEAKLPLVGDDLMDQIGATIIHKMILKHLSEQGVRILKTYQLDVGGGLESLDTLERTRKIKRQVKTKSVSSVLPYAAEVVAGSTDYVDFLQNRRDSYFWIEGLYYAKTPFQIDIKLSTLDAPNAGSMLLDVVRAVKIALERKISGVLEAVAAYAFKSPPKVVSWDQAQKMFEDFVTRKMEV
ncbi:inositol-3-phosphate synthase [Candidatus Bathyarchaeota archaeon]|nr:inositol-3-phosphate synthase [Candidatus Bathyarchaeota archaeon]